MTKTEKIAWLMIFLIILEIMPKEENVLNEPTYQNHVTKQLSMSEIKTDRIILNFTL